MPSEYHQEQEQYHVQAKVISSRLERMSHPCKKNMCRKEKYGTKWEEYHLQARGITTLADWGNNTPNKQGYQSLQIMIMLIASRYCCVLCSFHLDKVVF